MPTGQSLTARVSESFDDDDDDDADDDHWCSESDVKKLRSMQPCNLRLPHPPPRTSLSHAVWSYRYIYIYTRVDPRIKYAEIA